MSGRPYTNEQLDFLRARAPIMIIHELTRAFNEMFGGNRSCSGIREACRTHTITRKRLRHRPPATGAIYTHEQLAFLRNQAPLMTIYELAKAFNEAYGQHRSYFGIRAACLNNNINPKCMRRRNSPPGTEFIDASGYIRVKTAAPRMRDGRIWTRKHVVIWENSHGPVPKGFCIIFADGNKRNFALDNLVKVSCAEMGSLSLHKLWSADPELTKSAVNIARLKAAIRGREKVMSGSTPLSA